METTPSSTRFPTFSRVGRAVSGRWAAYAIIGLVTLIALFYAVENFRGQRMWERYRKDAEARGLQLDFAAHVPPTIRDEENAASTPLIQSWFSKPGEFEPNWPGLYTNAQHLIERRKIGDSRYLKDLVAWKEALARSDKESDKKPTERIRERHREPNERAEAAPAVLEALLVYQPALNELRAASKKPKVRYPVNYKTEEPFSILLPHLAKIKSVVQVLALKSSAELAVNKPQEALDDVLLMLWLAESMREEPFLINHLVRIACFEITAHSVWEGLVQHRWNDAQLKALQERLSELEFLGSIEKSMASERAGGVTAIDWLRRRGRISDFTEVSEDPGTYKHEETFADMITRSAPRGWFRMEAANYCRLMDLQLAGIVDVQKRTVDVERARENNKRLKGELKTRGISGVWHHRFLASLLLPALENASRKFALAQTTAHEAALACALERYRLANGKLPDGLDALVPKFIAKLPHDVLTGGLLNYERASDEEFVLSSTDWEAERATKMPGLWMWRSRAR